MRVPGIVEDASTIRPLRPIPAKAGTEVEIIVPEAKPETAEDLFRALQEAGLIGLWKDRTDIGDSSDFARKLRQQAETRHRP